MLHPVIERLRGVLSENDGEHVVLDVHGVGFGLDVPLSTANVLPPIGEQVELLTHLHIAEDAWHLYGFATREERDIFGIFLGVSGIGPRTALAILSSLRIADFADAVLNNDLARLTRVPGIGKKTAERLVVELRDKMKAWTIATRPADAGPIARTASATDQLLREISAALQALGCKTVIADRAAERALERLGEKASLEDLIREALKHRY